MSLRTLTLFERERRQLQRTPTGWMVPGDDGGPLRDDQLDALEAAALRLTGTECLTVSRRGVLRTTDFVGILQIGSLVVELLPKLDQQTAPDSFDARGNLLEMLTYGRHLPVLPREMASQDVQRLPLYDIVVSAFALSLEAAIRRGTWASYEPERAALRQLRGRIDFAAQVRARPANPTIACRHQRYALDNPLNRTLRAVTDRLRARPWSPVVRRALERSVDALASVPPIAPSSADRRRQSFDRQNRRFEAPFRWADLLLRSRVPAFRPGLSDAFGLLFYTPAVFEDWLSRLAEEYLPDWRVRSQVNLGHLLHAGGRGSMSQRPDLVLSGSDRTVIADIKYKRYPDGGPSEADVRQVLTYQLMSHSKGGVLVYPHHRNVVNHWRLLEADGTRTLATAGLDVHTPIRGAAGRQRVADALAQVLEGIRHEHRRAARLPVP